MCPSPTNVCSLITGEKYPALLIACYFFFPVFFVTSYIDSYIDVSWTTKHLAYDRSMPLTGNLHYSSLEKLTLRVLLSRTAKVSYETQQATETLLSLSVSVQSSSYPWYLVVTFLCLHPCNELVALESSSFVHHGISQTSSGLCITSCPANVSC